MRSGVRIAERFDQFVGHAGAFGRGLQETAFVLPWTADVFAAQAPTAHVVGLVGVAAQPLLAACSASAIVVVDAARRAVGGQEPPFPWIARGVPVPLRIEIHTIHGRTSSTVRGARVGRRRRRRVGRVDRSAREGQDASKKGPDYQRVACTCWSPMSRPALPVHPPRLSVNAVIANW